MTIEKERMIELEKMAKIDPCEEERKALTEKASFLADSFDDVFHIDTKDITPLVSVVDMKNVLREDVSEKTVTRDALLKNAPLTHNGYFQVPKTVD